MTNMYDPDDFIIKEGRADKPLGYPIRGIVRKALENLYISIVGALDVGDFETFLKESADLTYDEAKDKMVREFGTPKELSEARMKARSSEAASKLEIAEQEALAEQRTLEQEFDELDEVARQRLAENLTLTHRNDELEKEVKRLKEELLKVKVVPPPVPRVTAPPSPAAHGSMYHEFKRRISEVVSIQEINEVANEIYEIAEREEYSKLPKSDITELIEDLRRIGERRSMKLAEMKIPEIKPTVRKVKPLDRVEAPPAFVGVLPPQVMHRYLRPDIEEANFAGQNFIIDHELIRTIIRNNLLLFPAVVCTSPSGKGQEIWLGFSECV